MFQPISGFDQSSEVLVHFATGSESGVQQSVQLSLMILCAHKKIHDLRKCSTCLCRVSFLFRASASSACLLYLCCFESPPLGSTETSNRQLEPSSAAISQTCNMSLHLFCRHSPLLLRCQGVCVEWDRVRGDTQKKKLRWSPEIYKEACVTLSANLDRNKCRRVRIMLHERRNENQTVDKPEVPTQHESRLCTIYMQPVGTEQKK